MSVKYLVSGGEGALGKTVISMLLQRGEKVRILMSELSDTRIYRNNPNIEICYGISTDKDSMREFFELDDPRSAVLFHTDEYVSLSDATNLTMRRVNVIGAENVVDMCLKRKVGKLVYLSSAYALNPEVKGEDITIHFDRNKVAGEYAKSKAEAAAYVMEKVALNRLNAVMVLPTFIIGPGYSEDYEINKVLNSYLNNGTIPPKEGGRAFVDVRDVANAMLTLADKGEPGAGYIVSGDYKTSGEFFQDVNDIKGIEKPVKTASKLVMSKSLAKLVDFYYKITHKENPRQAYSLFSDNPDARFEDNSKGILPELTISFKDSLNDTIKGAQSGGIQAAAAVAPKTEKKPADNAQGKAEKKSSAEAMEARLKQSQNVTSKAHTVSTTVEEAPLRPAHTRPATAAAQAAAAKAAAEEAEKAVKEEAPKSIIPQSTLKDPEAGAKAEEVSKSNSESAFRFGSTPAKFTNAEVPQKSIIPKTETKSPSAPEAAKTEPVKSIIPPAAPKTEPVKSIIPPAEPKVSPASKETEATKVSEEPKQAATSGFPRAAATPSSAPAAQRPATSGFPRTAATPSAAPAAQRPASSGFPRAAATPSSAPAAQRPATSGFPRAAATPSSEPAAQRPATSGFPRAAATPSSAPATDVKTNEAPKEKEASAPEESVKEAPKSSGFPRATATPSSAPAAQRPATSGFPRAAATPSSAPAAQRPASSGFPRATATPSSGFPRAAATPSSAPAEPKEEPVKQAADPVKNPVQSAPNPFRSTEPSPFKSAQSTGSSLGNGSSLGGGSTLKSESSLVGGSTLKSESSLGGGATLLSESSLGGGSTLGSGSSLGGGSSLNGSATLNPDSSKQSVNYAFMSAQAEHSPFKPAQSSDPSPFKPAQAAAPKEGNSSPFSSAFKPAQSVVPADKTESATPFSSAFKPAQSAASAPKAETASPFSSAFKPAEPKAPAAKTESGSPSPFSSAFKPAESNAAAAPAPKVTERLSFSDSDLADLEDEIDKFGVPSGPVVPPGIFAPPPKPGRD